MPPWDSWENEKLRNILPQSPFNGYMPSKRVWWWVQDSGQRIGYLIQNCISHFKVIRYFKGITLK